MRYNWFLPSVFSFVMTSLPATAGEILSWQFNAADNRIDFNTSDGVKPEAQLLANPSRLIVDLPDTILKQPTSYQSLGNGIKSFRVGQFDTDRTRMVVELDPNYALDPSQVLIQGSTAKKWSIQLPTPQSVSAFPQGAPVGAVSVFNENGQIITAQPPSVRIPTNNGSSVNYIALDPSRTGLLLQSDRRNKTQLKYTTRWESQNTTRVTILNAKLAPGYKIPNDAQAYLKVNEVGTNISILIRRADGVRADTVRQYIDSRWAYLYPVGGEIAVRPPVVISVPPEKSGGDPSPVRTNERVLVMIDPGHGGKDPGAIGPSGLREVDVILPIGKRVAAILERRGIATKLTRNEDYFVGLDERVTMSRDAGATLFVSIHANSIDNRPDVNGLETYHYNLGQSFADTVHRTVVDYVNSHGFFIADRRVRSARFLVLRKSSIPAILVETGYLTNESEVARLSRDDYRQVMAEAIAEGIVQYVKDRN